MSAPPNRDFITLINNKMFSSLLTSLFLKKQKLEKVKSFQDTLLLIKLALVAQSGKNQQGTNKTIQRWKTTI